MRTTNIFRITPVKNNFDSNKMKNYLIKLIRSSLTIEPRVELKSQDERSYHVVVKPKRHTDITSFQQYEIIKSTLINEGLLAQ